MEDLVRQLGMDASFAHFAATGLEPCSAQVRVLAHDSDGVWLWVMLSGTDMEPWAGKDLSEVVFADLDRDF